MARSVTPALALALAFALAVRLSLLGCLPKEDVTPVILVSPGAKERIVAMDRLRHRGAPKRLLPHVTVEEVDDDELAATNGGDASTDPANEERDAGDALDRAESGPAEAPSR